MRGKIAESEAQIAERAKMVERTFTAVGEHIAATTTDAARAIADNTRELTTVLDSRSLEMSRILDEQAKPLVERFAASGSEIERSMAAATEKATARMLSDNANFVDALSKQTAESLDLVADVKRRSPAKPATSSSASLPRMVSWPSLSISPQQAWGRWTES